MPHRCTCKHSGDEGPGPGCVQMICLKCGGESYERPNFDPRIDLLFSRPFPRKPLIWVSKEEMAATDNIRVNGLRSKKALTLFELLKAHQWHPVEECVEYLRSRGVPAETTPAKSTICFHFISGQPSGTAGKLSPHSDTGKGGR